MWIKHLLGVFTTYFLIILSTPPEGYTALGTIGFTVVIYFWFFLTTKMHVHFWIPMILAILASYFIYVYKMQSATDADAAAKAAGNTNTDKEDAKTADTLKTIQKVSILFAAALTVLGVLAYYGEKQIEYGDAFDSRVFWMGEPDCKSRTPPVSISRSLLAAVGVNAKRG
jgi:Ca2+/Na+ antiporter